MATPSGGGIDELEISLLQDLPFVLHQQRLAVLGSHRTTLQHDKAIGHVTVVDKANRGLMFLSDRS